MNKTLSSLSAIATLALALACSSSSNPTVCSCSIGGQALACGASACIDSTEYGCTTDGMSVDNGGCIGDDSGADDFPDGSACVPLSGPCAGGNVALCCATVDGPVVNCATRGKDTATTCGSSPGGPCTQDLDCTVGACGTAGSCELSKLGGPCAVDADCVSTSDGGDAVECGAGGACIVSSGDAG